MQSVLYRNLPMPISIVLDPSACSSAVLALGREGSACRFAILTSTGQVHRTPGGDTRCRGHVAKETGKFTDPLTGNYWYTRGCRWTPAGIKGLPARRSLPNYIVMGVLSTRNSDADHIAPIIVILKLHSLQGAVHEKKEFKGYTHLEVTA